MGFPPPPRYFTLYNIVSTFPNIGRTIEATAEALEPVRAEILATKANLEPFTWSAIIGEMPLGEATMDFSASSVLLPL